MTKKIHKFKNINKIISILTLVVSIITAINIAGGGIKTHAQTTTPEKCFAPTGINEPISPTAQYKTNWSSPFQCNFKKFDPQLGKLKSIKFILDGSVLGNIKIERKDNDDQNINVKSIARAEILMGNPFDPTVTLIAILPEAVINDNLPKFDGIADFAGTSGKSNIGIKGQATNSITITTDSVISNYIGTGTSNITIPITTTGKSSCEGGGNLACENETFSSGVATLIYEYIPKPIAKDATRSNTIPNENVNLNTALVAESTESQVNFYTIKTLPDPLVCKLILKSNNGEIDVMIGQALDANQIKELFCKPSPNSEGKSTKFTYTATDTNIQESNVATVDVNLVKKEEVASSQQSTIPSTPYTNNQPTKIVEIKATEISSQSKTPTANIDTQGPIVEATVSKGDTPIKTQDCDINSTKSQYINVANCVKTISGIAKYYTVSGFRNGNSKDNQECGNFYLNNVKIIENQRISIEDSGKIYFSFNDQKCQKCDIGFNFMATDATGKESNTSKVNINIDCPDIESTAANKPLEQYNNLPRTGGYMENYKEIFTLIAILIVSTIFFFSSLSVKKS